MLKGGRIDYFRYVLWVRLKNLDFDGVSLEELGLSQERSVHHSASGGVYLQSVLKGVEIRVGSRALDLGSGKGSAVSTLARFPFEEIVGIELSYELVSIAEANVRRLGLKNVHFVCMDAGRFTDLDRFTHIYMFNPFPASVMQEVLDNLAVSFARKPRDLTLIYYYPVCDDVVMRSGLFRIVKKMTFPFSHPFFVYRHHARESDLSDVTENP